MSAALTVLADFLRSRRDALDLPLAACVEILTQGAAPAPFDPLQQRSAKGDAPPLSAVLAEMIAHAQPRTLLEYLRWVQGATAGASSHAQELTRTLLCFEKVITEAFPEQAQAAHDFLETARLLVQPDKETAAAPEASPGSLHPLAARYLEALLATDRHKAWQIIEDALSSGMAIKDIYLLVFEATQYEIGRLWQENRLSVAQEHYCTATTQLIMSRLYPRIFSGEKRGRRVVVACVGGELHELGVRMVADFFEMDGWDSYYAGAGSSESVLLKAVERHTPHVVGLSATLTAHVRRVEKMMEALRRHFGSAAKILVGGRPFKQQPELWKQMGADGYGANARQAVEVAESLVSVAA